MSAIKWFAGMARSYGCPAKSFPDKFKLIIPLFDSKTPAPFHHWEWNTLALNISGSNRASVCRHRFNSRLARNKESRAQRLTYIGPEQKKAAQPSCAAFCLPGNA